MLMTDRQFRALAILSGVGESTLSHKACRDIYVHGETQALAARTYELRPQTVHAARTRIELVRSQLSGRLQLIQDAMGV